MMSLMQLMVNERGELVNEAGWVGGECLVLLMAAAEPMARHKTTTNDYQMFLRPLLVAVDTLMWTSGDCLQFPQFKAAART